MLKKELEKRKLPDLFLNEENVDVIRWEEYFKPYWKEVLLKEEYGYIPLHIQPAITEKEISIDFAGKAKWIEVTFRFEKDDKSHEFRTQLIYPKKDEKLPFFININFRPEIPDRALPIEEIIDSGFGVFSVCYKDITSDDGDFTNGIAKLFIDGDRSSTDCGKIMMWAYVLSKMVDYLQEKPFVDINRIGVAGHSRLGKTALLAGAIDSRFSFVCANNSGCSGASLSRARYEWSESIKNITETFPHWFCKNYLKYANNEDKLPFDQHALISLIAPRKVYVGGAIEDTWADNDNQYLALVASSKVWELYGERGFIYPDRLPIEGDEFYSGNLGFHLRKGTHFFSRDDWNTYIKSLKNK